jgi:hypothetical protein
MMNIESKGYKLELTAEEGQMLHKIACNCTGIMTEDMGLTKEEKEHFSEFYLMMDKHFTKEQI